MSHLSITEAVPGDERPEAVWGVHFTDDEQTGADTVLRARWPKSRWFGRTAWSWRAAEARYCGAVGSRVP